METLLLLLAWGGAVAAFLAGGWLFIDPEVRTILSQPWREAWRAWRGRLRPERFFYRHHRLSGLIVLSAAVFITTHLWEPFRLQVDTPVAAMSPEAQFREVLLEAALAFLLLNALACLLLGVVVLWRPSLLKGFERWANRPWQGVGLRAALSRLRLRLGLLLVNHPRAIALTAMSGALFILWQLARR
ncbi:MAG: hypothetical protein HQL56_16835 [Magnetococcales bacterium]|nr:hypothetical protein [Magnetococcales bacterium]